MIFILLGIVTFVVAIPIVFIVETERKQWKNNQTLFQKDSINKGDSSVLVAYFSRSGNTAVMAKTIAKEKNAHLIEIISEDYEMGYQGWLNANKDARKFETKISYPKINWQKYDTLYIGSPIWWYSPSPTIFQFIKNEDIKGKKVFLFLSFNSKYEQKYIEEFKTLVKEKGGIFLGIIEVKRGRMTRQISQDSLIKNTTEQIKNCH
jgi:flavodoxin